MDIASPKEPVYYYECSRGVFRLVYFIPREELHQLHETGRISEQALKDLPDGVDLGCTEPDFAEFRALYGYRPPIDPEALQRAFYTVFSTTRDWQTFRGSGFIPAADLEKHVATVDEELNSCNLPPAGLESLPDRPTPVQRRKWMVRRARKQIRIEKILRRLRAKGIDSGKTLRQQRFSRIRMGPGRPAEEVFSELHQRKRR